MYTVLIVDDEPASLKVLELLIQKYYGTVFSCLKCLSAREALKIVAQEHPCIVITDIKMPVMDGIALVEQLYSLDSPPSQ